MLDIQKNISLKNFSTFHIGGPAKFFVAIENEEELIEAVKYTRENSLPFFILGGGSNVLFSDEGFKGLVIRIQNAKYEILDTKIECGAGVILSKMVIEAVASSLSGLEWASGIPGTIGGAVRGNAGAFGGTISDNIEKVKVLDVETLEIENYSKEQCLFSYRESIFKKNPKLIVVAATFELTKGDQAAIEKKGQEISAKRSAVQPKGFSSGSFFKNPVIANEKILSQFEIEKGIQTQDNIIPAGWLIEKSGLIGQKVGGMEVSSKHGNFIINSNNGTAQDAIILISLIKQKVRDKFGVELQEEIQYVGF